MGYTYTCDLGGAKHTNETGCTTLLLEHNILRLTPPKSQKEGFIFEHLTARDWSVKPVRKVHSQLCLLAPEVCTNSTPG